MKGLLDFWEVQWRRGRCTKNVRNEARERGKAFVTWEKDLSTDCQKK